MKITRITTTTVFADWRNWTFVEVFTDQGLVGLGEGTLRCREHAVVGAVEDMARVLIGQDPFDIQALWQMLYRDFHNRGGAVLMIAISAIEIALWDILGQALGIPIYQLLGGRVRKNARAYANGWFKDARHPDQFARYARDYVDKGFTALKWNPFFGCSEGWMSAGHMREAIERVQAVREAVGNDVDLMIEAHGLFAPSFALKVADQLAPHHPLFLEEPCPPEDVSAMAFIRSRSPIPIATGERLYSKFEFANLIEARGADIIQPDVTHSGGLMEARLVAAMAETRYINIAPHNSGSPVSTAASLQLDACIPNFFIQELPVEDVLWRDEMIDPPVEGINNGTLFISDRPGLGIKLNHKIAALHPYQDPESAAASVNTTPESEQLSSRIKGSEER